MIKMAAIAIPLFRAKYGRVIVPDPRIAVTNEKMDPFTPPCLNWRPKNRTGVETAWQHALCGSWFCWPLLKERPVLPKPSAVPSISSSSNLDDSDLLLSPRYPMISLVYRIVESTIMRTSRIIRKIDLQLTNQNWISETKNWINKFWLSNFIKLRCSEDRKEFFWCVQISFWTSIDKNRSF